MSETDATTKENYAVAIHEAAHAVLALAFKRPVHRVSILPKQRTAGRCELKRGVQKGHLDTLEAEVLISLAGLVAEALFLGRYDLAGASQDLRYARGLLISRVGERALARAEQRLMKKTQHLLGVAAHEAAIKRIACELLASKTISGRVAQHIYQDEQARQGDT